MADGLLGDRFWSKVNVGTADECWEWTAATNEHGYGVMNVDGRTVKAHRLIMGEPEGIVMHHCDNPPCVNPAHLVVATQSANVRDMYAKGRQGRRASGGEANGNATLTAAIVEEMRERFADGDTLKELAGRYGVWPSTIATIVRGDAWVGAGGPITRLTPGRRPNSTKRRHLNAR